MPSQATRDQFRQNTFGMFIHFGPYSAVGRGEQVLFREHLDPVQYERDACAWNPTACDFRSLARLARHAGMKYAVFTTRHHDGYCLWDSQWTNYTSFKQAPKRDFVCEYIEAFRTEGLQTGLYYSLADWRIPAYWEGPEHDPAGWESFRNYIHGQIRELLTHYGPIATLWFDGAWPHSAEIWQSRAIVSMARQLQPECLLNNRLGTSAGGNHADGGMGAGESIELGDFGTPEHHSTADPNGRIWEACHPTTWRLWGYANGEHYRHENTLLDMLTDAASKGGNLLLNVGPDGNGHIPHQVCESLTQIGNWMKHHGECIYGAEGGDVIESVTYGRQIVKGNCLYLIFRFWPGMPQYRIAGLGSKVVRATLLSTHKEIPFEQSDTELILQDLPEISPTPLFPVIRLECEGKPVPTNHAWAQERLWSGDPRRMTSWAKTRLAVQNLKNEFRAAQ